MWRYRFLAVVDDILRDAGGGAALTSFANHTLLEYLIRSQQQRGRDGEAEGLGGLEVDDKCPPARVLDRKITGLCAVQELLHVPMMGLSGFQTSPARVSPGKASSKSWSSFDRSIPP